MEQNCPECGSYNIQYITSGIICNDCINKPIQILADTNTSKKQSRCNRCKREYEIEDIDPDDRNFNIERLCPDCEFDIAEREIIGAYFFGNQVIK